MAGTKREGDDISKNKNKRPKMERKASEDEEFEWTLPR